MTNVTRSRFAVKIYLSQEKFVSVFQRLLLFMGTWRSTICKQENSLQLWGASLKNIFLFFKLPLWLFWSRFGQILSKGSPGGHVHCLSTKDYIILIFSSVKFVHILNAWYFQNFCLLCSSAWENFRLIEGSYLGVDLSPSANQLRLNLSDWSCMIMTFLKSGKCSYLKKKKEKEKKRKKERKKETLTINFIVADS